MEIACIFWNYQKAILNQKVFLFKINDFWHQHHYTFTGF